MIKDTSIIPKGRYCYNENGICPYWSKDNDHEYQENGYCAYLEKGDWDLNKEKQWLEGYNNRLVKDIPREKWKSAEEIGLLLSLLWDQIKECDVSIEEDDKEVL